MNSNVFIDSKSLFRSTTIGLIICLLLLVVGMFFVIKYNVLQSLFVVSFFNILKISFLVGYIALIVVWLKGSADAYILAFQKNPFMHIHDTGLTFTQGSTITHIPWNQVLSIDRIINSWGISINFVKGAPVPRRYPFAKFGPHSVVTLSYITMPYEELYVNLLAYKDQFSKQ